MASDDDQTHTLMSIPLEVRHQIFHYVAVRDAQPKKLLRYWFEKKEMKEKTAKLVAQNPNASASQLVYADDDSESEEPEEDHEDESTEDHEEDSNHDEEDIDSDQYHDSETDEADEEESAVPNTSHGQANTLLTSANTTSSAQGLTATVLPPSQTTVTSGLTSTAQATAVLTAAQNSTTVSLAPMPSATVTHDQEEIDDGDSVADLEGNDEEYHDAQDEIAEGEESQMDNEIEDEDDGVVMYVDGDEEMVEGEDDEEEAAAVAAQPLPPLPVIKAHRKWRHIPKFMRITHRPPPVELFLASKELNAEAKSWFYDVAVFRIDATGSFAHTSFFEEAFSQITEAAFSPMENICKAEATFVWDTTWLRSEQADCAAAIFPALLRQRAIFVTNILAQAPSLKEVVIHWHDSAEDEEAVDLMNDVLAGFLSLKAAIKVEPHIIAADEKPYRKSVAGKQRVEFQRIVENGLDRLF